MMFTADLPAEGVNHNVPHGVLMCVSRLRPKPLACSRVNHNVPIGVLMCGGCLEVLMLQHGQSAFCLCARPLASAKGGRALPALRPLTSGSWGLCMACPC